MNTDPMAALYAQAPAHKRNNLRGGDVLAAALIVAHTMQKTKLNDILLLVPQQTAQIMRELDKDVINGPHVRTNARGTTDG